MKKKLCIMIVFLFCCINSCTFYPDNEFIVKDEKVLLEQITTYKDLDNSLFVNNDNIYIYNNINNIKEIYSENNHIDSKTNLNEFMMSPDYQKILYTETYYEVIDDQLSFKKTVLKIYDGNQAFEVPVWNYKNQYPIGWLNNGTIIISTTEENDGTVILFHLDTMEYQKINPVMDDFYNLDPIKWYVINNPLPLYNETMSKVFYLRYIDSNEGHMQYVLYDINEDRINWSKIVHDPQQRPQWSPKDDMLVIAIPDGLESHFELFSINTEGLEEKLTDFDSVYDTTFIKGISWSPDGSKIGFWLDGRNGEESSNPRLAIYDFNTKSVIRYNFFQGSTEILWASTGNQIAFSAKDNEDPEKYYLIVLDLNRNIAMQVSTQEEPVSWLLLN